MSDQYRVHVEKSNFNGKYDVSSVMVTVSGGVAVYSSVEMMFLIATTFKTWHSLYFWSLSLCNLGVLLYAFGFMMVYFELATLGVSKTLNDIGWIGMVVCQSLVLYSRLGLIVSNVNILKAVKWMIIINSVILVPFPIIFDYGTSFTELSVFPKGFFYIEHIQIIVFSVQECIISGLYVFKTIALLRSIQKMNTRGVMWQLLIINIIIIPMDITLIVMQFLKLQLFQEGVKVFVYAVKLKFELHILSKLVDFIRDNERQRTMTVGATIDSNSVAGEGQASHMLEISLSSKSVDGFDSSKNEISTGARQMKSNQAISRWQSNTSAAPSVGGRDENMTKISSMDFGNAPALSLQYTGSSSQRLRGRESDALYADVIRSL